MLQAMRFSQNSSATHQIQAYDAKGFRIDQRRFEGHLALSADRVLSPWGPPEFADLRAADFAPVWGLEPEILVLGAGPLHRWPEAELYHALMSRGIGVEVMSTPAACRTYNILSAEGRRVAAALFTV